MKYLLLIALLFAVSCDNASVIWEKLRKTYSRAGTAGIMGNLEAESALKSVIYQNSYKGSVGLTDQQYVNQVNSGAYSEYKFVHDSVGFGLAQWTYYSRKQGLYDKCKKGRGDIGNLSCQVDFVLDELKGTKLANYLKTTTDVYTATSRVCKEYERPAVNNIDTRYNYAMKHYNRFK